MVYTNLVKGWSQSSARLRERQRLTLARRAEFGAATGGRAAEEPVSVVGSVIKLTEGHENVLVRRMRIRCMKVDSSRGEFLAIGEASGTVRLVRLGDGDALATLASSPADAARLSHSGSVGGVEWFGLDPGILVSCSVSGGVVVWDTSSMRAVSDFRNREAHSFVTSLSMSSAREVQDGALPGPTQNLVACASNKGKILMWDLESGANTHSLAGHEGACTAVSWSPRDPYLLASGGNDGIVKLWDVRKSGAFLASLDRFGEGSLRALESDYKRVKVASVPHSAHAGQVDAVAFDGDGLLSLSSSEGALRRWNLVDAASYTYRDALNFYGSEISSLKIVLSHTCRAVFLTKRGAGSHVDVCDARLGGRGFARLIGMVSDDASLCVARSDARSETFASGKHHANLGTYVLMRWRALVAREDEEAVEDDRDDWSDL